MKINIVWLKKDLRLFDHEPLFRAVEDCHKFSSKLLIVYLFEPSIMNYPDFSEKHLQFINDSILNLNSRLKQFNSQICTFKEEAESFFQMIIKKYEEVEIEIYAHEEIGNGISFIRDENIRLFFKENKINFNEYQTNGIIRGKYNSKWHAKWFDRMKEDLFNPQYSKDIFLEHKSDYLPKLFRNHKLQVGGEIEAHQRLKKFCEYPIKNYRYSLSSPNKAIKNCSRLSPYLAFGNISIKQIYRFIHKHSNYQNYKKDFEAFLDRLHWHCHFIQRFEYFPEAEFENLNENFNQIRNEHDETFHQAFIDGNTGIPMVDACIRSLKATGYINFRMRSMLVSFYTHHLFLSWKNIAHFLAQNFLDYEPGIHYCQLQMQAGTMGIHTLRIYNPILQGIEKDPKGEFILTWVPELKKLPIEFVHRPWDIPTLIASTLDFQLGKDYPTPIVDVELAAKHARKVLWEVKKSDETKKAAKKILKKRAN